MNKFYLIIIYSLYALSPQAMNLKDIKSGITNSLNQSNITYVEELVQNNILYESLKKVLLAHAHELLIIAIDHNSLTIIKYVVNLGVDVNF